MTLPSTTPAWTFTRTDDPHGPLVTAARGPVALRFRWVWPGVFTMGRGQRGRTSYDETPHEVTLTGGCWLGDAPVTQEVWEAVMGETPSGVRGPDRPVVRVSWDDAQRLLARLEDEAPGFGARLPTEAWWERACRAGTDAATWAGPARPEVIDRIAWCGDNNPEGTIQPVRGKEPNPWGFHDLLGNVWEWCSDWQARYPTAPVTDPAGPDAGVGRVLRGGMFLTMGKKLSASLRMAEPPSGRDESMGLRLACAPGSAPWEPAAHRE